MAHDPAKVGDEVRLLTGMLDKPAMLDGPGAAPVKRNLWVRVPPLALALES